jgi:hypothetical protein
MADIRITIARHDVAQTLAQPRAQTANQPQTREQLRENIRHSIEDATIAADQAANRALIAVDGRQVTVNGRTITVGPNVPGVPQPPALPGGVVVRGYDSEHIIPSQLVDIALAFMLMIAVIIVGLPLARAFGRRIERRADSPAVGPGLADQLQRIEQAVEAMSIEVERISESQRFMARLQSETNGVTQPERVALPANRA